MKIKTEISLVTCLLVSAVAIQIPCYADVTKLSAEHRKALQNSSRFHEIRATKNLPPAVVALCADESGRLAEPGQKWEITDVITDVTLPRKRLIWAVTDGEYYVVHYERGGYGHSFHVLVVTLTKGDAAPRDTWYGVGNQLKNYPAFIAALHKGELDDSLNYAH
ncbi:MAG: hypothetical protein WC324_02385 [Candidatus Omnitrophota bacterium]|jgi:hypothetical protein